MATTQNTYTGNGSTTNYSITFEYLKQSDVKASLDGTATTAFTFANATTLSFNTAPANSVAIRIFRDTDVDALQATFFPGSAIKAEDLNDNFTQNNFATQEAVFDVDTANATANTAKTTADTAIATANTASTNATNAVSTANTADTNASAAVSTANTASTNATNAVNTANTASTNASNAVTTANTASTNATAALNNSRESDGSGGFVSAITKANTSITTANSASTAASNAVTTANTASTNATNAVTTANSAASDATSAVSTANTASTNASTALSTANTASTNATAALNNSRESDGSGGYTSAITKANTAITTANSASTTANTASTNASSAVTTANSAVATANAASQAVANAAFFQPIAALANLPSSPSNEDRVEVINSTGVQSSSAVSGVPSGFVGSSDLTVRLQYNSSTSKWVWQQYFAVDPENRYATNYLPVIKGDGTSSGQVGKITLNCSNNNHGVSIQSPPHSAGATYGLTLPTALPGSSGQALTSDTSGNLSFTDVSAGDGTVTTAKLADDAVTAAKLADTAVTAGSYTAADITVDAQGRVTAAASGQISTGEIASNAVTAGKLATDSVTTAKIADDAVTAAKLADTSVTAGSYTFANVTVDAQGRVTAASSGTVPAAAGSFSAVASGAISNGDPVLLNSDGTVTKVGINNQAFSVSGELDFAQYEVEQTDLAYVPNTKKILIVYHDKNNNNYGTIRCGTISGSTITWGTPFVFSSSNNNFCRVVVNESTGHIVVAGWLGSYYMLKTLTLSGTTFTATGYDATPLSSGSWRAGRLWYNPTKAQIVMFAGYTSGTLGMRITAGTVASNGSMSFSGNANLRSEAVSSSYAFGFDPGTNKYVVAYKNTSGVRYAAHAYFSGSNIDWGSAYQMQGNDPTLATATGNGFVYDTEHSQLWYYKSGGSSGSTLYIDFYPITTSGSTPSWGTRKRLTFTNEGSDIFWVVYNTNLKKYTIFFRENYSRGDKLSSGELDYDGTSFTKTAVTNSTTRKMYSQTQNAALYSPGADRCIMSYYSYDDSVSPTDYNGSVSIVQNSGSVSNLEEDKYLGISDGAYANGASATIQIQGSVDDAQSGLTIGSKYYVQSNGSLGTTAATPSVFAGTAVSATQLMVKQTLG